MYEYIFWKVLRMLSNLKTLTCTCVTYVSKLDNRIVRDLQYLFF